MKLLTAIKTSDGWLVTVEFSYTVRTKDDVFKLARYEGLLVDTELMKYDENKIVAN